jgi:hypothetical protein
MAMKIPAFLKRKPVDPVKAAAEAIDKYFDKKLVDGMPVSVALEIEHQRNVAHMQLAEQVISGGEYTKVRRIG